MCPSSWGEKGQREASDRGKGLPGDGLSGQVDPVRVDGLQHSTQRSVTGSPVRLADVVAQTGEGAEFRG